MAENSQRFNGTGVGKVFFGIDCEKDLRIPGRPKILPNLPVENLRIFGVVEKDEGKEFHLCDGLESMQQFHDRHTGLGVEISWASGLIPTHAWTPPREGERYVVF